MRLRSSKPNSKRKRNRDFLSIPFSLFTAGHHCVVKALINNFQPEDADTLEAFVTSVTDGDILHAVGMDIIYCEINPLIPESVLLYLYENNPCSSCRNRVFLSLMVRYGDMTNLPEPLASIRKEAQLDCDYGTAMIARGQSIGQSINKGE